MGLLIPIVHAERVRDAPHAARVFRALGHEHVFTTGWMTTAPATIDRLIAAAGSAAAGSAAAGSAAAGSAAAGYAAAGPAGTLEHTIAFARGTLDDSALEALRHLATAGAGYLDVSTTTATLRVWPGRAWMHGLRTPPESVQAILGLDRPLKIGTTTIDDVTCKRNPAGPVPFDVATPRADIAFQLFRACADSHVRRGHISGLVEGTHAHLATLLHAIHAEVTADLELDLAAATELTELTELTARSERSAALPDVEWSAADVTIKLPSGEISTHLLLPVPAAEAAAWHARIADALARAA